MAVSTVTNRVAYQGNGSSAVFNFPYRFHAQAHLGVFVYNSSVTDGSIIVPQVLNTHYTISGTANSQGIYTSGADVVFNSSPNSQAQIVIFRSSVVTNDFALSQNGAIPSTALNNELDYLTLIAQRYQDQASRSVKMPDGYPRAFDPNLPANLATSAGKRLIVNSSATGWTFDETLGNYIPNTVVVAVTNSSITSLGGAPADRVLTSQGSSLPIWGTISIGSGSVSAGVITGILAVENGGTGITTPFNNPGVLYANSSTFGVVAPTASGEVLTSQGSSAPIYQAFNYASQGTGILPVGNGGTGTGTSYIQYGVVFASSATQIANTVAGGGDVPLVGNAGAAPSFKALNIASGSSVTGALPISFGGTGQTAQSTAFNALSPMTTLGDLIYGGASGVGTRLGVGAAGQILTASSANGVAWANAAAGFTNPMTASGDIIVGSGAGTAVRLAVGTTGQMLTSTGSSSLGLQWQAPFMGVANGGTGTGTSYIQYGVLFASSATQIANTNTGGVGTVFGGNGSSAPSFKTFPSPQKQIFSTAGSSTFTVGSNMTTATYIKVTVTGGGGGGGGGDASNSGGGGGGGGGSAIKWLTGLAPGTVIVTSVGPGGAGGGAQTTGSTGATSFIDATSVIMVRGLAGTGGTAGAATRPYRGGVGGGATLGDINADGTSGGFSSYAGAGNGIGGVGGGSIYGGGGLGGHDTAGQESGGAGDLGGGGGGGGSRAGATNGDGGAGGAGVIVFEWV